MIGPRQKASSDGARTRGLGDRLQPPRGGILRRQFAKVRVTPNLHCGSFEFRDSRRAPALTYGLGAPGDPLARGQLVHAS